MPATRRHRASRPQETALSSIATILPLAADESGFHTPSIADFFPHPFLFEGTLLEFNRMQLVRVIATVVLVTIMVIAARRAKLVPSRGQNAVELLLDFVRVNVCLLYTSPSPRDRQKSRMPSSA